MVATASARGLRGSCSPPQLPHVHVTVRSTPGGVCCETQAAGASPAAAAAAATAAEVAAAAAVAALRQRPAHGMLPPAAHQQPQAAAAAAEQQQQQSSSSSDSLPCPRLAYFRLSGRACFTSSLEFAVKACANTCVSPASHHNGSSADLPGAAHQDLAGYGVSRLTGRPPA
jgi:hypothetical protein